MRVLPCQSKRCGGPLIPFLRYRPAYLPLRVPYTLLSWPATIPNTFTYKCAVCLRKSALTAVEFTSLPSLTLEQLRSLKLDGIVTKDLRGAGVTPDQQAQLEAAGLTVADLVVNR